MAYLLGIEASDLVAAIAPVEGALMVETSGPARPMPLMLFNSVDDRYVPYQGRFGRPGHFTPVTPYPRVDEEIARWRGFDGCLAAAQIGPALKGAPGSADADNSATRYEWRPCAGGDKIVEWKLAGSGHVWPGATRGVLTFTFFGTGTKRPDHDQPWEFIRSFFAAGRTRVRRFE